MVKKEKGENYSPKEPLRKSYEDELESYFNKEDNE